MMLRVRIHRAGVLVGNKPSPIALADVPNALPMSTCTMTSPLGTSPSIWNWGDMKSSRARIGQPDLSLAHRLGRSYVACLLRPQTAQPLFAPRPDSQRVRPGSRIADTVRPTTKSARERDALFTAPVSHVMALWCSYLVSPEPVQPLSFLSLSLSPALDHVQGLLLRHWVLSLLSCTSCTNSNHSCRQCRDDPLFIVHVDPPKLCSAIFLISVSISSGLFSCTSEV